MKNEQLSELMEKRKKAQGALLVSMQNMEGASPMSLMMNPKALGGVFDALKESASLNDQVVTELAQRSLDQSPRLD